MEDNSLKDRDKPLQKQEPLKQIEDFVRDYPHAISHGFDHIRRVYNLCLFIGKVESANLHILLPAALMHDIGRDLEEHLGADHAESAEFLSKDFLKLINYPKEHINEIFNVIRSHSSNPEHMPETLEAKILSDSDKLDSLGAMGVARVFTFGGSRGRDIDGTVNYFRERVRKINEQLYTTTARRIANERIKFIQAFLEKMHEENTGLR